MSNVVALPPSKKPSRRALLMEIVKLVRECPVHPLRAPKRKVFASHLERLGSLISRLEAALTAHTPLPMRIRRVRLTEIPLPDPEDDVDRRARPLLVEDEISALITEAIDEAMRDSPPRPPDLFALYLDRLESVVSALEGVLLATNSGPTRGESLRKGGKLARAGRPKTMRVSRPRS